MICKCSHLKDSHKGQYNTGICAIGTCRCSRFEVEEPQQLEPIEYPCVVLPIRKVVKTTKIGGPYCGFTVSDQSWG